MIIASVPYNGELPKNLEFDWEIEHIIELGADMREAYFLRNISTLIHEQPRSPFYEPPLKI